jgi:hypothetical protein
MAKNPDDASLPSKRRTKQAAQQPADVEETTTLPPQSDEGGEKRQPNPPAQRAVQQPAEIEEQDTLPPQSDEGGVGTSESKPIDPPDAQEAAQQTKETSPVEPESTDQWSDWLQSIRSVGGFFSALLSTGVVLASFWFIGRRYAEGSQDAMNIPSSLITLSDWDYAEVGGFYFSLALLLPIVIALWFLYFALMNSNRIELNVKILICCLATVVVLIYAYHNSQNSWDLFAFLLYAILPLILNMLDSKYGKRNIKVVDRQAAFSFPTRILFSSTLVCVSVFAYISFLSVVVGPFAFNGGKSRGRAFIADRTMPAVVTLAVSLPNVTSTTIPSNSGDELFVYDNLRLLLYHDGRYHFFQGVDSVCSPQQVFTVAQEQVQTLQLQPESSLRATCTPENTPTPTPTFTAIPATSPTVAPTSQTPLATVTVQSAPTP